MRDQAVLIAGGGVVGSAMAWALANRGFSNIVVVDLDLAGLYASSELNAGGARATWWQRVNVETCAATLEFFRAHRDEFGFRERGYLWLYEDERLFDKAKASIELQNQFALGVETLSVDDLGTRFPILDRCLEPLVGATFSPKDGLVNPNAVRQWYRREAEALGARFLNRHYIQGVTTMGGTSRSVQSLDVAEVRAFDPLDGEGVIRRILTTHALPRDTVVAEEHLDCDLVINCLGAWSPIFSAKIGIGDVTEPTRRQICLFRVQSEDRARLDALTALGMVVDSSNLYFHPEGGDVLAGYSIPNETPGYDFDYDGEAFFMDQIWPRLGARSSVFEHCRHLRGWSGLYAVTPDCSGIAGAVGGFTNLYEAHSFTGRGVMQSYGIAVAIAELIDTGRSTIDISALSRTRFSDPQRWVVEDLHI